MTFLFFSAANTALFERSDAERAEHNHQEMSLDALFPYDNAKVITQGMRIGYTDALGVFQVFEIIKVKNYEPDHYQEVTSEHIAISELTDEIYTGGDIMDETPSDALQAVLSGTLWSVGNVTATNVSSVKLSFSDVWSDVRAIEKNWNVYITPRVTFGAGGITGRYLDIAPAQATWRGLMFSLDKNMDDASVTWDDAKLKTALYGYGKKSMTVAGESEKQPWTFASVTWAAEYGHPAKPEGQIYLEDPDATAAYGRNGRPRYGYYQNGDIEDPEKLLELTWKTLQTVSVPDVTISGAVRDITRFGAVDVPIRLHDLAHVEIRPTGVVLNKEVVQYTDDLIQPENSRVTIGTYIPNIIYITKDIANGGGGGGSGGQSDEEYQLTEFETEIAANSYEISLRAWQRDLEKTDENLLLAYAAIGISSSQISSIVTGSGVQLNPDGTIVTDSNGLPVFAAGSSQMWSNIQQQAGQIALVVTGTGQNAAVNAASIVAAVNGAGSSVTINADKIVLNGQTLVTELSAIEANFTNLTSGLATATKLNTTTLQASQILMGSGGGYSQLTGGTLTVCTGVTAPALCFVGGQNAPNIDHYHDITVTESSGVITITTGAASATAVTANFNMADTAYYRNAVSAARSAGGVLDGPHWGATITDSTNSYTINSAGGGSVTQQMSLTRQSGWSNGNRYVYMNADGNQKARILMSLPATADSWSFNSQTNVVTCTVCGKSYTYSI